MKNICVISLNMKTLTVSFILLFLSLVSYSSEAESEPWNMGFGLWEGINDTAGTDYHLLQLQENGKHRLFISHFASGFHRNKILDFTDKDISCTTSECLISIEYIYDTTSNIRLIVTPYLDNYLNVLDMRIDNNGKPIITYAYRLEKNQGKSTVRQFIERYSTTIKSIDSSINEGHYGFWIGVAYTDDKKQLIVLNIKETGPSELVLMLNGDSWTNETSFDNGNIFIEGNLANISTSHDTFANQVILHQQSGNQMSGHYYSYLKGQVLSPTDFKLFRVIKP